MSQENLERFWEGIDGLRRQDAGAILDGMSEDVVCIPGRSAVEVHLQRARGSSPVPRGHR
jgi:hypothetical protein